MTWPNPADTPLDAARTVAREYRAALLDVAPVICQRLDTRACGRGQVWVTPQLMHHGPEDWIPEAELAPLLGVENGTLRVWAHRGKQRRFQGDDGVWRYRVGDAIDEQARQRRARLRRAQKRGA